MIVQNTSHDGTTDISFTVPEQDLVRDPRSRQALVARARGDECLDDDDVARVSVVGAGMKTHPGVTATMFETLARGGDQHRDDLHVADPHLLHGPRPTADDAVRALHKAFELG